MFQRVAVTDLRAVDVVQYQVGDGQQVRQRFFLDAVQAGVEGGAVFDGFDLRLKCIERGDEKAAGAAGEIGNRFAQFGVDHLHHKVGDGARGIKLA